MDDPSFFLIPRLFVICCCPIDWINQMCSGRRMNSINKCRNRRRFPIIFLLTHTQLSWIVSKMMMNHCAAFSRIPSSSRCCAVAIGSRRERRSRHADISFFFYVDWGEKFEKGERNGPSSTQDPANHWWKLQLIPRWRPSRRDGQDWHKNFRLLSLVRQLQ